MEQQELDRTELQRTLLNLRPARVVMRFTKAHLDMVLWAGFKDLASFQVYAAPNIVVRKLMQAGLPVWHSRVIEGLRGASHGCVGSVPFKYKPLPCYAVSCYNASVAEQQPGLQEVDAGGQDSSHSGGETRPAGPHPAAQTPSQDADHLRDQEPTRGASPSTSKSTSTGWWSSWSTQPRQPQPLPPGSTTSSSNMAAPAAAASALHSAAATAPTAGREQVVLPADDDVAAHSSVAATSTAPASWHLTTCRRRHVHRPAMGQE